MAEQQIASDFKTWVGNSDMPAGKKKVVLAALKLFSEKGFDGTSTQEIAKASGMSQATIFKYFKTKEDLLTFIITPLMDRILPVYVEDFRDSLEQRKNNLELLIHYVVRSRYEFLADNREVASIVFSEILTKDRVRSKFIGLMTDRGEKILKVFNNLVNKNDEVRSDIKPEALIRLVVSQILFYFLQNYKIFEPRDPKQVDQDLNEIEKLIISAIKK
ncbi:TetR/AcrR family transcriptional regulator [Companilactobacillus huachuanensis]|uniref:TetR/AcrR family transcriptional regulator n=1 Tax=Companilactobacillus huachuanensis TaxID=2559914 RepID=A0ABW1RMG1_9LACO|nr:TetR/AcrR family transcriptional regulator [Companilactobacillus huachuanensis]